MTKKISILLSVLIIQILTAQPQRQVAEQPFRNKFPFFAEVHVIPKDSVNIIDYVYKIPYNQLIFVKDDNKYKAGLNLTVEVYDTSGHFIARQIKQSKIGVNEFSETNSPELFSEGLIEFKLPNDEYNIMPNISDVQSGQSAKLEPYRVKKFNSENRRCLNPIIVNEKKINIDGKAVFVLTNYEDSFPFDSKQYNLIIPCADTSLQKIYVSIINNRDTIFTDFVSQSYLSGVAFEEYENKIILNPKRNNQVFRNFILKNFSDKLSEGNVKIKISKDKGKDILGTFDKNVIWYDKPFSLRNPEFAIKSLKYMERDSVISKLLDGDKPGYPAELERYWKKYDPTPGTKFNELMNEYYSRIDYALKNFAPLTGRSGADTDRGRIFIKFGKPAKVERSSDDNGKVVELWIYTKENLSFMFVDKNGTGEFPLVKG